MERGISRETFSIDDSTFSVVEEKGAIFIYSIHVKDGIKNAMAIYMIMVWYKIWYTKKKPSLSLKFSKMTQTSTQHGLSHKLQLFMALMVHK